MAAIDLLLLHLVVASLLIAAAVHDIATRTVPNWISIAIIAAGVALQAIAGSLLIACGLAFGVLIAGEIARRKGWLGGADVKLLAASAIAVSPGLVGHLLIAVSLAGGVLALVYLMGSFFTRRPAPGPRSHFVHRVIKAEAWRIHRRGPLPYATAIAVGGLITIFAS